MREGVEKNERLGERVGRRAGFAERRREGGKGSESRLGANGVRDKGRGDWGTWRGGRGLRREAGSRGGCGEEITAGTQRKFWAEGQDMEARQAEEKEGGGHAWLGWGVPESLSSL